MRYIDRRREERGRVGKLLLHPGGVLEREVVMAKFDWEGLNREKPVGFKPYVKGNKWSDLQRLAWKDKKKKEMDEALEKYGWQVCPRCGGGRHPMFSCCKRCRGET